MDTAPVSDEQELQRAEQELAAEFPDDEKAAPAVTHSKPSAEASEESDEPEPEESESGQEKESETEPEEHKEPEGEEAIEKPAVPEDAKAKTKKEVEAWYRRTNAKFEAMKKERDDAKAAAQLTQQPQPLQPATQPQTQQPPPQQRKPEDTSAHWARVHASLSQRLQSGDPAVTQDMLNEAAIRFDECRLDERVESKLEQREARQRQAAVEEQERKYQHYLLERTKRIEASGPQFEILGADGKIVANDYTKEIARRMQADGVPFNYERMLAYAAEVRADYYSGSFKLAKAEAVQSQQLAKAVLRKTGLGSSTRTGQPPLQTNEARVKKLVALAEKGDRKAMEELANMEAAAVFG